MSVHDISSVENDVKDDQPKMIIIDTTAQARPPNGDSELVISDEEDSKRESDEDQNVPKDHI